MWPIHRRQALEFLGAYVLLTGVWTFVGWLLTNPLDDSAILRADTRLARWFARDNTHWVEVAARWGAELSGTMTKIAVTSVIAIAMLFVWKRWLESLVVGLTLALEASVFVTSTTLVGRPRPPVRHLENSPIGSSFPSGHTAAAAAYGAIVVVIFWHTRKRVVRVAAVAVTVAVCVIVAVCRMYMGMHYLSDVLAGLALGATCVAVTVRILCSSPEADDALAEEGTRLDDAPDRSEVQVGSLSTSPVSH
jgi:membrane-associated phospholipid phosphatase